MTPGLLRWLHRLGWPLAATIACAPCGAQAGSAQGASPNGAGRAPFRSLVLQREDPQSGSLRFDLIGESRELSRKQRRLRPDCPQHWEARCWEERVDRGILTPAAMQRIVRGAADVRAAARPGLPFPGESNVQVVIDLGDAGVVTALSTDSAPDAAVIRLESILVEAAAAR